MQTIINQNTKKWRIDDLNALVNSFDETIGNMVEEKQIKDESDYSNVLLNIAGKSIVTTREIICLVSYGFADGAMSLARTIYEHFIIVDFLYCHQGYNDFNNIIEDYYLDLLLLKGIWEQTKKTETQQDLSFSVRIFLPKKYLQKY